MRHAIWLILSLTANAATAQPLCLREAVLALSPITSSFYAPSGSMKPTLEPGDCFVSIQQTDPAAYAPGQIVTFDEDGRTFIKRIVATAGQTVQMQGGRLVINGAPVSRVPAAPYSQVMARELDSLPFCPTPTPRGQTCLIEQYTETLGGVSYNTLDLGGRALDQTGVYTVPQGHVFVMGDHRDNSADSRVTRAAGGRGFVALDQITGLVSTP